MKINSHNEWDKLLEIIVGSARGTSAVIEWHKEEKIKSEVLKNLLHKQDNICVAIMMQKNLK